MNIGIFWLGELDPDIPEFCSNLFNPHPLISLTLFSNHKSNICNALAREENSYNFDEINALCDVFKSSIENNLEFAIINYGNSFPMSASAIYGLMQDISKKNIIWSLRHSEISGAGIRHSPRLPFIDENFIVLNVLEAKKRAFFKRKLCNSIHFSNVGGVNSVLQSMFEFSLKHDEFSNHFEEGFGRDQFGNNCKLKSFPFFFCEKYKYLTCYQVYSPSIKRLFFKNSSIALTNDFSDNNFIFLKRIFQFSKLLAFLNSPFILVTLETFQPPIA